MLSPRSIGSCGSYLDGGTNVPFQEAAIPMLEPGLVKKEMIALQNHFRDKRDYVVGRLRAMGFTIKLVPDSTFVGILQPVSPKSQLTSHSTSGSIWRASPAPSPMVSTSSRPASRKRLS